MMLKYPARAMPTKAVMDVSTSLIELLASVFKAREAYFLAARLLYIRRAKDTAAAKNATKRASSGLAIAEGFRNS
jgi:hypothetical protein